MKVIEINELKSFSFLLSYIHYDNSSKTFTIPTEIIKYLDYIRIGWTYNKITGIISIKCKPTDLSFLLEVINRDTE